MLSKNPLNHNKKSRRKKRRGVKKTKYDEYDTDSCYLGIVKNIITNKIAVVQDINTNVFIHCKMRNKIDCRLLHVDDVVIYSILSEKSLENIKNGTFNKTGEILNKIISNEIRECADYFNVNINKINSMCSSFITSTDIVLNQTRDDMNVDIVREQRDYFSFDISDSDCDYSDNEKFDDKQIDNEKYNIKCSVIEHTPLNIDNI